MSLVSLRLFVYVCVSCLSAYVVYTCLLNVLLGHKAALMPGQLRDSSLSPCLRVYTCVSVPRYVCVCVCVLYVSVLCLMSLRVFVYLSLARRIVPQRLPPCLGGSVSRARPHVSVYECV